MRTHRRKYNAKGITRKLLYILSGALIIVLGTFLLGITKDSQPEDKRVDAPCVTGGYVVEKVVEPIESTEEMIEMPVEQVVYVDTNNSIYPYNTMSADWGTELYEEGFKYYEIPEEYVEKGGCLPEVVQAYLWCLCKDRGIDYYVVLALIERESQYKYSASGDNGNSKGYMQVYEKWHKDRMQEEYCTDLYNPYGNIRVGTNFLREILNEYSDISKALMVYNMGESGAIKQWDKGVFETKYSRGIINRAQELQQELKE